MSDIVDWSLPVFRSHCLSLQVPTGHYYSLKVIACLQKSVSKSISVSLPVSSSHCQSLALSTHLKWSLSTFESHSLSLTVPAGYCLFVVVASYLYQY